MKAKKVVALTLLAILLLSAFACGGGGEVATPTPTPTLTPTPTPTPTETPIPLPIAPSEAIEIVSSTAYYGDYGYLYPLIVGEVRNLLDQKMLWAKIQADFYDSRGSIIASAFTYDLYDVIEPAEKAPFYLQTHYDTFPMGTIPETYSLSVAAYEVIDNGGFEGLTTSNDFGQVTSIGYKVTGQVKNGSDYVARNVTVVATFYDSEGDVIAVDAQYAEDRTLSPSERSRFEVSTAPLRVYPSRYSLHALAE